MRLAADGTAIVTFSTPYAFSSALSGYTVEIPSPCHKGTNGVPVERDVSAGAIVHVTIPDLFANACRRTMTVRVIYEGNRHRFPLGEPETIVGETTVRRRHEPRDRRRPGK